MHILYVNSYLSRGDTEQGIWGHKFIYELRNAGVEVTTIPPTEDNPHPQSSSRSAHSFQHRRPLRSHIPAWLFNVLLEPVLIARGLLNTVWTWFRVRRCREHLPDLVYARVGYWDWAPWLIGWMLKRPVIAEVQGLNYIERSFRGRRRSWLLRVFELVQLRRVTFVRVSSKPLMELLQEEGIDRKRIRFIPLGVEIMPRLNHGNKGREDTCKFVFVGSFYPWHGVEVLLRAFALTLSELPRAQLELIGDGLTRRANEQLAKALRIDEAIDFKGWLPREVMLERVRSSDIAVAPFLTLHYFDPAKVFDYMSTGVAIIASRLERTCAILQEGRGGVLVPPGDVESLAVEMVRLSRDPHRRAVLGSSAQDILIEEGYQSSAIIEKVLSLCAEAIE